METVTQTSCHRSAGRVSSGDNHNNAHAYGSSFMPLNETLSFTVWTFFSEFWVYINHNLQFWCLSPDKHWNSEFITQQFWLYKLQFRTYISQFWLFLWILSWRLVILTFLPQKSKFTSHISVLFSRILRSYLGIKKKISEFWVCIPQVWHFSLNPYLASPWICFNPW